MKDMTESAWELDTRSSSMGRGPQTHRPKYLQRPLGGGLPYYRPLRDLDGTHLSLFFPPSCPQSSPCAISQPLYQSTLTMSFVKLSIFGTSFEVRPLHHEPWMP